MCDGNRSYVDMCEVKYVCVMDNWEFRIGVDKVFWGVMEVVYLVDIINQTDLVESIDGEEKFGQLMVMVSIVQNFGMVIGYLLFYFRECIFVSCSGCSVFDLMVDETQTKYESGVK
jgi:hypothetical protein